MPNGLLVGEDNLVASWVYQTWGLFPMRIDRAYGILGGNGLKGAILLHNFNGTNLELSYYGPRSLTPGIARAIAKAVVAEFNAARVTVVTSKKNKRLMRAILKFGFKLEGAQRRYYGHQDCNRNTGVRFVMFREQIDKIARFPISQFEQIKS